MKCARKLATAILTILITLFSLSTVSARTISSKSLADGAAVLQTLDRSNPQMNRIYQEIEDRLPETAKNGSPDSPLLDNLPDKYRSMAAKDDDFIFIKRPDGTIGVTDKKRVSRGLTAAVAHLAQSKDVAPLFRQNYDRIKAEFDRRKEKFLQKNNGTSPSAIAVSFAARRIKFPAKDTSPTTLSRWIRTIWSFAASSRVMGEIADRSNELKQEELARIARDDPQPEPKPVDTAGNDDKAADDSKTADARERERQEAEVARLEAEARERQEAEVARQEAEARERERQQAEVARRVAEARERERQQAAAVNQATRAVAACSVAQNQINNALQQFYQGGNGRARQLLQSARADISKIPPGTCDGLNDRINNGLRTVDRASAIARAANDAVNRCDTTQIAAIKARYASSNYGGKDRVIGKLDAAAKKCDKLRRSRTARERIDNLRRSNAEALQRRRNARHSHTRRRARKPTRSIRERSLQRWRIERQRRQATLRERRQRSLDRRRRRQQPQYIDPNTAATIFGGFLGAVGQVRRRQRSRSRIINRQRSRSSTTRTQRQPQRRTTTQGRCGNGTFNRGSCRGGLGALGSGGVREKSPRLRQLLRQRRQSLQ